MLWLEDLLAPPGTGATSPGTGGYREDFSIFGGWGSWLLSGRGMNEGGEGVGDNTQRSSLVPSPSHFHGSFFSILREMKF